MVGHKLGEFAPTRVQGHIKDDRKSEAPMMAPQRLNIRPPAVRAVRLGEQGAAG